MSQLSTEDNKLPFFVKLLEETMTVGSDKVSAQGRLAKFFPTSLPTRSQLLCWVLRETILRYIQLQEVINEWSLGTRARICDSIQVELE